MTTTTWVYEVVKYPATRKFTCRVCGKPGKLTKTFRQTINPFNKNAAGQVKFRSEIQTELSAQAASWDPDPVHVKCQS